MRVCVGSCAPRHSAVALTLVDDHIRYTAIVGSTEVTTILLALGADAGKSTNPDSSLGMPKRLVALHFAVMNGHPGVAAILCAHSGTEVDPLDAEKRSPLHWAAYNGAADAVSTLTAYGANPMVHT